MKIDNSIGSTGAPTQNDATSRTPAAGTTAPAPADTGSGDAVNLSALSSQMQSVGASLANAPVVNQAQVNEIKQAITEGRFKVNPEVVADRLLDTVREIINNKAA
jgi:negative regulator of flagellin synthesis FlgM